MPRYEGRDKTARFIQFAARFIVGLLARVFCLQVMCAALSFQMPRISKILIVARKWSNHVYSRFSRKLDHELLDYTKKHQLHLRTSKNNKPFAYTAGSCFPKFSPKHLNFIEVRLICSISIHIYPYLPCSSHGFPRVFPWFSSDPRRGEML